MAATRDDPRGRAVAPLTIGAPALRQFDGHTLVAATIETGDRAYPARYQTPTGPVASGAEPFLAAALPVAMRLGRPLRVDGPVSAQLLASLPSIQAIYHAWNPNWRVVPVSAAPAQPVAPHQGGVACFFSGGVDSFYTLLKHLDEIDTLIFIHGFDIPARELAKPLLEVETNLKDLIIRHAPWEYAHGALLASIALLLSPRFARVYIAASDSYGMAVTKPWGSHPLLDPLWSTERTTIAHDGCEATRTDKVASIVRSDIALRWLRVCWENPNGEYNCGRCGKCLRTMVCLRIAGALDRCRTFDHPLDLAALARTRLFNDQSYMLNYLEPAKRADDWELLRALRDNSGRYRRGLRPLAGRLRRWATRSASRATGFIRRHTPPAPAPRR